MPTMQTSMGSIGIRTCLKMRLIVRLQLYLLPMSSGTASIWEADESGTVKNLRACEKILTMQMFKQGDKAHLAAAEKMKTLMFSPL